PKVEHGDLKVTPLAGLAAGDESRHDGKCRLYTGEDVEPIAHANRLLRTIAAENAEPRTHRGSRPVCGKINVGALTKSRDRGGDEPGMRAAPGAESKLSADPTRIIRDEAVGCRQEVVHDLPADWPA